MFGGGEGRIERRLEVEGRRRAGVRLEDVEEERVGAQQLPERVWWRQ